MSMPDEYTPTTLRPKTTTRDSVGYAVALVGPKHCAILDGPFTGVMHALEVVPGHQDAKVVQLNTDGSETILYDWTVFRGISPPKWVRRK